MGWDVGGRYRALLIGNSTYLADEHNLQTLKGPVKDIAVLNRALVDPDTGLFDDVDVTLLPEATSSRAIRTMGRFFGSAERDDVLLVYFSGHGKLDENGRLHLCMQDTESTDLLATAVSSTRINEFADASSARNVVIVLDCCHAGAFRGGELGDAVDNASHFLGAWKDGKTAERKNMCVRCGLAVICSDHAFGPRHPSTFRLVRFGGGVAATGAAFGCGSATAAVAGREVRRARRRSPSPVTRRWGICLPSARRQRSM